MVELVRENNVGGELVDGKWRDGVMEALTSGEADVALVAEESDRSLTEHIDFTYPWAAVSVSINVKLPSFQMIAQTFQGLTPTLPFQLI